MSGLLRVPFFGDELLTSYLSRTAVANGSESLRSFCSDVGLDYRGIIRGDSNEVAKTARLLGRPQGDLLGRRVALKGRRSVEYAGLVFDRGMMNRTPLRYCPDCLDEDDHDASRMPGTRRYARTSWAFRYVRTCERHSRPLLTLEKARRWSDGLDFLATPLTAPAELERTSTPPSGFERFVIDRLQGRVGHGAILDGFPLPACIDLCEQLGSAIFSPGRQGPRNEGHGFDVLVAGELGVLELFDLVANRMDDRRPGEQNKLAETINYVSMLVGCSSPELRTLVLSAFLRSLVGEAGRAAYRNASYLRAQMMGLRERLIQLTKPLHEGQRKWTPAGVVNALLLSRESRLSDAPAPFVGKEPVESIKIGDVPGSMTSLGGAEVRKRLSISQRGLNQLVAGGILGACAVERTGNISIPLEGIMRFEQRYVTIARLAAEHGLSPSQMKQRCLRSGLASAFPAHLSETTIFERAAVENVFGGREGVGEQYEEEIGMPIALATDTRPGREIRSLRKRKLSRLPARGERSLPAHACGVLL